METITTAIQLNTSTELPVTGEICMSANYYYITHLPGSDNDCYILQYPFQHHQPLPQSCHCIIKSINEGVPYIEQDKFWLLGSFYQENKVYPFKIISQAIDPKTQKNYLLLTDQYQFSSRLYLSDQDTNNSELIFLPDTDIRCAVRKIDPRGFLILGLEGTANSLKVFVTAERLFTEIGHPEDTKPYFFRMRKIMEQDIFIRHPFHSLFKEYEMCQNLWIFSYLRFLSEYIDLLSSQWKDKQYETIEKLVTLLCKIELWMIEGSNFLENFSLEKALVMHETAENNISKARKITAAIGLIKNGKAETYITRLLQTAERSSYVRNTDGHIQILIRLSILSPATLIRHRNKILKLLSILVPNKGISLSGIKFMANLLETYQKILYRKDKCPHIQLLLNAGLLLCYQELDDHVSFAVKKSRMFRYIGKITRKENTRRSIDCLLNYDQPGLDAGFGWKDLIGFRFITLPLIGIPPKGASTTLQERKIISDTDGQIIFTPQHIVIYPPQNELKEVPYLLTAEKTKFISLLKNQLIVALPLETSSLRDLTLSQQNKVWIAAQTKTGAETLVSQRRLARVTIQQITKKAVIAKIEDKNNPVRISAMNISKWYIPDLSLEDIFMPGDCFMAEIISDTVCPDLSIRNICWDITREVYQPGDTVKALCLSRDESGNYYWITEHGLYAYSKPAHYTPKINCVYRTSIKGHSDSMQAVILEAFNQVQDESYKPETLIRNFIKHFLTPGSTSMEPVVSLAGCRLITKELLDILLDEFRQEKDEQQQFYILQAGLSIINMTKNNLLSYFMSELNYLINIDKFRNSEYKEIYQPIQAKLKTAPFYQEMAIKREICTLLSFFLVDNEAVIPLLYDKINEDRDGQFGKLAELILTANLLKRSNIIDDPVLLPIKEKILVLLKANPMPTRPPEQQPSAPQQEAAVPIKQPAVTHHEVIPANFGIESTTREFKTSIVYPPGQAGADMPMQMDTILRTISAFLNSKGGTLFIGIHNDGSIRGIQADLTYLNGDEDLYERIIRQHIVENLSKDINSLVEFKFRHYNKNTVCEIAIPPYERPVFYKRRLWQRQGNECRVIKKSDMPDYWRRRFPKQDLFEKEIDMLEDEVLFYLVISEDNRCLLTNQKPDEQKVQGVLQVKDYCKDGFLLLGYEDGRFNKIPLLHLQTELRMGDIYLENSHNIRPVFLTAIPRHLLLAIYTEKEQEKCVKIYDTANIPARTNPKGKGQLIVGNGKHRVSNIKLIDYEYRNRLKDLFYLSTAPVGVYMEDGRYKEDIRYLDRMKCITEVLRLK